MSAPKKSDLVRDVADDLRRALREAIGVAERLDESRRFVGRIDGWRDLAQRADEVLR